MVAVFVKVSEVFGLELATKITEVIVVDRNVVVNHEVNI